MGDAVVDTRTVRKWPNPSTAVPVFLALWELVVTVRCISFGGDVYVDLQWCVFSATFGWGRSICEQDALDFVMTMGCSDLQRSLFCV